MNNQDKAPQGIIPNLPLWSYQLQQNSKLAVKTRKELEIDLITRALKDDDFRQELLANPKAVVEKEIGAKLPEELKIKVLEETEDTLYMVLPCNPYEGISEEDLKTLVGMTYKDVAQWVLDQQRNALLDDESSVRLMVRAWNDEIFRQELLTNPKLVIEQELEEKIEEDTKIRVLREDFNISYLILPKLQDNFVEFLHSTEITLETNMPMIIGSGDLVCGKASIGGSRFKCPSPPQV